jgi:hypothetical protein
MGGMTMHDLKGIQRANDLAVAHAILESYGVQRDRLIAVDEEDGEGRGLLLAYQLRYAEKDGGRHAQT